MIQSEFSNDSFYVLEKNELQQIGFIGDRVHVMITNYKTNEYKTKCGLEGVAHINNVVINNNTFSYSCLKCFNITKKERNNIVENLLSRGQIA